MRKFIFGAVALPTALLATTVLTQPRAATAAATDYRFELIEPSLPADRDVMVAVRLIHLPTGRPVANAVIFRTRLDMSPDAMGEMVEPITAVGSPEPGVYRFLTKLSMAGRWALSLQAKVPGETETVQGTVVVTGTVPNSPALGIPAPGTPAGAAAPHKH